RQFWNCFAQADVFGSLIQPDPTLTARLGDHLATLDSAGDLLSADTLYRAQRVIDQASYLTRDHAVVVANPPYMGSKQMSAQLSQFMKYEYPDAKSDLFSGFFYRCLNLTERGGQLGFMSPYVWMFISSYQKVRERFINQETITSLIQLEYSGFDGATVPICTFTVQRGHQDYAAGYVRLSDFVGAAQQATRALEIIKSGITKEQRRTTALLEMARHFYRRTSSDLLGIPGSPIVYWLSEKMRAAFVKGEPLSEIAPARLGMRTGDNQKWLRYWFEVSRNSFLDSALDATSAKESGASWFPYNKGGDFRKWYGNRDYVVFWRDDGHKIKAETLEKYPQLSWDNLGWKISNENDFFKESLTWTFVSSGDFGIRWSPQGTLFDVGGSSVFTQGEYDLYAVLGFLSSSTALHFFAAINPTLNYQVANVNSLPWIKPTFDKSGQVNEVVYELIRSFKKDWDSSETSWEFQKNPLVAVATDSQ
ncbi:MAG: N-6 DNA methylase, partial [Propionibacteriaceae bacterium]|nr:N-6 DNA methylase [Propionibacteriaceae bacterium]